MPIRTVYANEQYTSILLKPKKNFKVYEESIRQDPHVCSEKRTSYLALGRRLAFIKLLPTVPKMRFSCIL